MGGGPRTFPGGVSKWQWKRMQAERAKHMLKDRLSREHQLYQMRKRAELKIAISELERPWEAVKRAPFLFSISANEQVKALADRFKLPAGVDLWSERDGPRIFRFPDDVPSNHSFENGGKPCKVVQNLRDGRSYCSDSELVVTGFRKDGDKIDGRSSPNGRNRSSPPSDFEARMDRDGEGGRQNSGSKTQSETTGGFCRKFIRNPRSYRSPMKIAGKLDGNGRSSYSYSSDSAHVAETSGKVLLRPWTELRLESECHGRREQKL